MARKCDGDRVGRWNCHECLASYNVLSGTIFEKTRIPLQKWFLGIALMVNAKKSLSSYQIARDCDLTQPTALYMQQRIRAAMAADQASMLQGIVEADETFVGGKPRKANRRMDDHNRPNRPRGRGTKKISVVGAVERGGKVTARVATDLKARTLLRFLRGTADPHGTLLITDQAQPYTAVPKHGYQHAVINHLRIYADGETHTNTIEGSWSLLKRAWYGSHHHYSRHWMPLFVAEASWKYNHHSDDNSFGSFLRGAMA